MRKPDGNSAFPGYKTIFLEGEDSIARRVDMPGMTLRDYFAAAALTGAVSSGRRHEQDVSAFCFKMASAMLAQREKE